MTKRELEQLGEMYKRVSRLKKQARAWDGNLPNDRVLDELLSMERVVVISSDYGEHGTGAAKLVGFLRAKGIKAEELDIDQLLTERESDISSDHRKERGDALNALGDYHIERILQEIHSLESYLNKR